MSASVHRKSIGFLTLAGAAMLAACGPRTVRVEVAAGEDGAVRTFATNRIDENDAERVRGLYGEGRMRTEGGETAFTAAFPDRLPSEIGNRNGLTSVASPLGSSHLYWESFHTSQDHWSDLSRRIAGGELWVRLFGRWAESRIEDPSKREEFRVVLETEYLPLTRDLMLAWSSMIATSQAHRVGARVRDGDEVDSLTGDERFRRIVFLPFVLMLGERGILDADETQRFTLLAAAGNPGDRQRRWSFDALIGPAMLRQIRRFVPDAEAPTYPSLLVSGLSFYFFANNSLRHRALLLESDALTAGERVLLERGEAIPMPPAFGVSIGGRSDPTRAEVSLKTPVKPHLTNGEWIESRSAVEFKSTVPDGVERVSLYPATFHAAWAVPNRSVQESCFGEVLLEGEELAAFCGWHQTLDEVQRDALDEALERLAEDRDRAAFSKAVEAIGASGLPAVLRRWIDDETA